MAIKVDEIKIKEEVEIFKEEYPDYDSEVIEEYLRLCDDFNPQEKDRFAQLLGY